MTVTTASTVRNIISSCFEINPRQIKLAGEISPNHRFQDADSHGGMWSDIMENHVWGFSPETGIEGINIYCGYDRRGDDKPTDHEEGQELFSIEGIEKFSFFIVYQVGEYSCPTNGERRVTNGWVVYKAPNFQQHRDQIEKADLKRWEEWYQA